MPTWLHLELLLFGSGLMLVGVKIDVEVLLVPWTLVIVLTVAASGLSGRLASPEGRVSTTGSQGISPPEEQPATGDWLICTG